MSMILKTTALWAGAVLISVDASEIKKNVDGAVTTRTGRTFPYGTLVVNLTGAVLLGLISGLALGHNGTLLAGTAAVGLYTTFSTWMFETQRLGGDRQMPALAANIVVSLVAGIAAAALGLALGRHL